ncbi:hypothetical protein JNK62_00905 [bacterium]|nr:hypothetical protein [bacterium]
MNSEKLPDSLTLATKVLPTGQVEDLSKIDLMELVDRMNFASRYARQVIPTHGNGDLFRQRTATAMNAVAHGKDPRIK